MAEKQATLILQLKEFVSGGLSKIGTSLNRFANNLDKSKLMFGAVAAASAFLGKSFLGAADKMEQWTISFTTMLGSAGKAKKLMEEVKVFAEKTPFELPDVIKGAKGLLAFGFAAEEIIPALKDVGDVSAGLGVPIERLILNLGQVKSQTKLTGRELRDFAIAGVPLLAELAKNLNMSEEEIQEMVSAGKIGFDEVRKAFSTMAGESGKFGGLMEKQMTTLTGKISNLQDAIFRVSSEIGEYLMPVAKYLVDRLMRLVDWFASLSHNVKFAITYFGVFTGLLAGLLAGLGVLVAIFPTIAAGFAVITSPIILITGLIGLLGVAIYSLVENSLGMRDAVIEIFEGLLETLSLLIEAFWELLTFKWDEAKETARMAFESIAEHSSNSLDKITSNAKKKYNQLLNTIKTHQKAAEKEVDLSHKKQEKRIQSFWDFVFQRQQIDKMTTEEFNKYKAKNFTDTLNYISNLTQFKSKELQAIGKIAAVGMATIDAYVAYNKALASLPPPFNYVVAGAVLATGLATVAKISGINLAEGGIVMPKQGGVVATLAEAGKPEAVIPLEDERVDEMLGNNITININAGTLVADDESIKSLAEKIDETLYSLKVNRETVSI